MDAFRDGTSVADLDPRDQLGRAFAILRGSAVIETPPSFALLSRVYAAIGGLLVRYRPAIQPFAILAPHLAAALTIADCPGRRKGSPAHVADGSKLLEYCGFCDLR